MTIPNYIEIISANAFEKCSQLVELKFQKDSKLKIIEECAFTNSSIASISIPSNLIHISQHSFAYCKKLHSIKISSNSSLKTIDKYAFLNTLIYEFTIPSSIVELKEGWCFNTPNLHKIEVEQNNKIFLNFENKFIIGKSIVTINEFDTIIIAQRNISEANIPYFIKQIGSYAFAGCKKLEKFDFQINSMLKLIDKYAFFESSIESLNIPSHVKDIGEYAFYSCDKLLIIEIDEKLELIINKNCFSKSKSLIIMTKINTK